MSDFLKGRNFIIVPRLTTVERNALTATNGMLVYDTTLNAFYKYENGAWSSFAGGSGTPAGSNTEIQFNDAGSFGAEAAFSYNKTTNVLTVDTVHTGTVQAHTSAGLIIEATGGGDVALFGAGGGQSATFYDGVKLDASTASRILGTDANKNITALDTTTYPTLTELSYVKGVTSAIQTQLGKCLYITSGNQITTSDTAQNITGLSITLLANTRYKIHGFIRFGLNNTGGTKFAATIPSGSMDIAMFGVGSTTTSFTRALLTSSGTLSAISFLNTNSTNGWVFVDGEVSVGVTGGTLQFQFASGTATQTSTINQLGTEIHVTQLV